MLPAEKRRAEEKRQDEQRKLASDAFTAMIKSQMESYQGRKFVRHVLKMLRYNEPNVENSAVAYRVAAMQNVAIQLYRQLYELVPEKVELMMREASEDG